MQKSWGMCYHSYSANVLKGNSWRRKTGGGVTGEIEWRQRKVVNEFEMGTDQEIHIVRTVSIPQGLGKCYIWSEV